jgi:ribose transport system substrate-binding protein
MGSREEAFSVRQSSVRREGGKLVVGAVVLAVAIFGLVACGGSESNESAGGTTTAGASGAKKQVTIAHFVAIQSNPVEQIIINSGQKVAKKDGAAKIVVFDSNNDVQREIANCKDAIASKKYDAFILKPVAGPPLMGCARDAIEAGIPVVAQGNVLGPNPETAKRQVPGLAAQVVELARVNGVGVANLANRACRAKNASPCNVIYVFGPPAFDWASISRKYFLRTVKANYPNIRVVATGLGNFDTDTTRTLVKNLLQTHSDVHVIAHDGDQEAWGSVRALEELGRTGEILVNGAAGSKQGVAYIRSGKMFGTTCLLPATEARVSAELAIKAARGQSLGPKVEIDVCTTYGPSGNVVTKKELAQFKPEW